MGADRSCSPDTERLRQVLGAFYKTVDVMKSARNSDSKNMNVWADDMKAVEDVVLFLENLRDDRPATPAGGEAKERVMGILDPDVLQLPKINLYKDRWDDAAAKADAILAAVQPAQCSAGIEDKQGARLSNWLADYSHDLMEDGDFDQEAAELGRAAQWIADRLSAPAQPSAVTSDATCYVERSMVRIGVMGTGDEVLLKWVDSLPIFTASDFTGAAQPSADIGPAPGTFAGVVVRRLNNLITTADPAITWEKEAADEMARAIQLIERLHTGDLAQPPQRPASERACNCQEGYCIDGYPFPCGVALSSTHGKASTTAGTVDIAEAALTIAIPSPGGK